MKAWIVSLAAVLLAACVPGTTVDTAGAVPVAVAPRSVELTASAGRKVPLSVWRAPSSRGVILFGHGLGGEPAAYRMVIDRLVGHGYSVVAPLSVDSRANPDRAKFDMRQGFTARVEDLMIARGYVHQAFSGQRVALAGHSYGSLFALIGAGAVTPAGAMKGPPVAAVLAFSSPGAIPQLVNERTYASVAVPLMMITGDRDVVPGFVPDARAHRLPFDTASAGGKYLVTVRDGGHDLAVTATAPAYPDVARLSLDFLDAYVSGDPAARARLDAAGSTPLYSVERR